MIDLTYIWVDVLGVWVSWYKRTDSSLGVNDEARYSITCVVDSLSIDSVVSCVVCDASTFLTYS